jgi:hypothetical protein
MPDINEITGQVVSTAYRIHTQLGPGLLEGVYVRSWRVHLRRKASEWNEKREFRSISMECASSMRVAWTC